MARVETSTYCYQHCWVGKIGDHCPKCHAAKREADRKEARRWAALSMEAKLDELYIRIQRLEREPYPDQRIG